ncbi:MAG: thioredoxin [Anaerolineales bacterium]
MADVPYVTEQDFQSEVLDSSLPVLVDFTAAWCGPCKMIAPIIAQLHVEWQGQVKVVQCDADQNPAVLMKYGILGIPTIMLFKAGKVAERVTGYLPKDKLVGKMLPHI